MILFTNFPELRQNRYPLCMNKIIGFIVLSSLGFGGFAQQLPKVYNQFFMNPYLYNPAYAGVEGHAVAFVTYKQQWTGIDGAPTLMNANFHVPLKGGLAIGAMAYTETAGLYTQSAGKITGGYLLSIDQEHFIRFGLSLGAGTNTLDFTGIEPGDPAFASYIENPSFLWGDFGVTYHFGHFNVGVAMPSLFNRDLLQTESGINFNPAPQDNLLFKANYRGHITDDFAIEPHLIYRYDKYLKNQYEATVIMHFLHIVWLGGTYRQDAGFIGLLGLKLFEKLGVGYSYEYGTPETASLAGPSHEIHLGYHISSRKEHAQHASSFIKSHRQSAEQRAKEEELERQRRLQALQASRAAATQQEDELTILQETEPEPEPEKPTSNWNYEKENDPVERVNKFGETERGIKFDRINENGEKEVVFSWLPPPPPGTTEETYEIANPDEEPLIRIKPDGTKEAGIKWIRTLDNGERETLVIWDEVMSEEVADELDHNPSTALALSDAKITIRKTPPVEEEPEPVVEEPVIIEESVVEEPVVEEPVVQEPDPVEIEKGDSDLTDDFRTEDELADSEDHLEVKRGGHLLELPAGNYVVAGVFENFWNAENYSDQLFARGYKQVKVGYLSARGYFYVVIFEGGMSSAVKERNRIRKNSGLDKVWVLKVNE